MKERSLCRYRLGFVLSAGLFASMLASGYLTSDECSQSYQQIWYRYQWDTCQCGWVPPKCKINQETETLEIICPDGTCPAGKFCGEGSNTATMVTSRTFWCTGGVCLMDSGCQYEAIANGEGEGERPTTCKCKQ
jgi:hypothetical protein